MRRGRTVAPDLRRFHSGVLWSPKHLSQFKLKRAVFFHERGKIRDRSFEAKPSAPPASTSSSEPLYVGARSVSNGPPSTWQNTSRDSGSPALSWEHINLTGIYTWDSDQHLPLGFRSLKLPVGPRRAASCGPICGSSSSRDPGYSPTAIPASNWNCERHRDIADVGAVAGSGGSYCSAK